MTKIKVATAVNPFDVHKYMNSNRRENFIYKHEAFSELTTDQ